MMKSLNHTGVAVAVSIVLGMLAVALGATQAYADQLFFDDFNDGTLGKWNEILGSWDVVVDGELGSNVAHLNVGTTPYRRIVSLDAVTNNGTITAKVKGNAVGDVADMAIGFHSNSNASAFYFVVLGRNASLAIYEFSGGQLHEKKFDDNYQSSNNVWYNVKIGLEGTTINVKRWVVGTSEPPGWQITWSGATPYGGHLILGGIAGDDNEEFWFDDVDVQGEGSPNPNVSVSSLIFDPPHPVEGEYTKIQAEISNIGDASADAHAVFYYNTYKINRPEGPQIVEGPWATISNPYEFSLNPGQTIPIEIAIDWQALGNYNLDNLQHEIGIEVSCENDPNLVNNQFWVSDPTRTELSIFDVYPDGFSFPNYEFTESEKSEIINDILSPWQWCPLIEIIRSIVYRLMIESGACHGISCASVLYKLRPSQNPNPSYSTWQATKSSSREIIKCYHIQQAHVILQQLINDIVDIWGGYDIDNAYEIVAYASRYHPLILTLRNDAGSHAVVAINSYNPPSGNHPSIILYDNNHPGVPKTGYIDFTQDRFYYDMGEGSNECKIVVSDALGATLLPTLRASRTNVHHEYNEDSLFFNTVEHWLSYDLISQDLRAFCVTTAVPSINILISDQYGRKTSDTGLDEIPNVKKEITDYTKLFLLPTTLYYNIEIMAHDEDSICVSDALPLSDSVLVQNIQYLQLNAGAVVLSIMDSCSMADSLLIDYDGDEIVDEVSGYDSLNTIYKTGLIAHFTYTPSNVHAGGEVLFNANSSYILPTESSTYSWDFGNGHTGEGKNVIHTYENVGEWEVKLILTENGDKTDSMKTMILVTYRPEKPNTPSGETLGYINMPYNYTCTGEDLDGDPLYYMFHWGDGSRTEWIGPFYSEESGFASHAWENVGVYTVAVRTMDSTGHVSEISESLYVEISCDCTGFCDMDQNGTYDPLDVSYIVNYVYLGQDARPTLPDCPGDNGDWNCDGGVDPLDVTWYVQYVYLTSGIGPCDPCNCVSYPSDCPGYP